MGLAKAGGTAAEPSQIFSLGGVTASYVRMNILDYHYDEGDGYVGLSEVQFSAVPIPEPSSMAMFGIGALGLFGYSRRRRQTSAAA